MNTSDQSFLARVQRIALGTAGAALFGVAAVQAWQVFARYVLNDSPGWTEPVALLLLATAMSLAAGAAVRSRSHFGFYVLVEASRPRVARALRALSDGAIAMVGGVIATYGALLLVDGWSVRMAGAPLPQGLPFLPLALGGSLMAVFALERLFGKREAPA
jgi:TRAP-type C4-dicarboxylate transport system permease small subunit